jgi:hypothetical protein
LQLNDLDGKVVNWLKRDGDASSYGEFLQKHFSLTENDIEKLEPKEKKKRKQRKRK